MKSIIHIPIFPKDRHELTHCLEEIYCGQVEIPPQIKTVLAESVTSSMLKEEDVYAAFITVSAERLIGHHLFTAGSLSTVVGNIIEPNARVMHAIYDLWKVVSSTLGHTKGGGPATVIFITECEKIPLKLISHIKNWLAREACIPSAFIFTLSRRCGWPDEWAVKDFATCSIHEMSDKQEDHRFTPLSRTVVQEVMQTFQYQ